MERELPQEPMSASKLARFTGMSEARIVRVGRQIEPPIVTMKDGRIVPEEFERLLDAVENEPRYS